MSDKDDTYRGIFWVRADDSWVAATPGESCDEIKRLRAENARLRGLMRDAVDGWDWWMVETHNRCSTVPGGAIENMRAALEEKP